MNTKPNNFIGLASASHDDGPSNDLSTSPFIQLCQKKKNTIPFFLIPEISLGGVTALQCAEALSTYRRIDSIEALPHASSISDRARIQLSMFQSASLFPLTEL